MTLDLYCMYHVMHVSSPMLGICVLMRLKMKRFMPVYTVRRRTYVIGSFYSIHSFDSFDLTFIHSFPSKIRRTRGGSMVVRLKYPFSLPRAMIVVKAY